MKDIRMIAFDLDGTLFTTDKQITQRTYDALKKASEKGISIVPSTGRFLKTIPESIKKMDYIEYIISINGAYVFNRIKKQPVYTAEIKKERAIEILAFLDTFPVAYDCYADNKSFMTRNMMENITTWVAEPFYLEMLKNSRYMVDELKEHLEKGNVDVQKMMAYTLDPGVKARVMEALNTQFKGLTITSSITENIEINDKGANKGIAIRKIAEDMGIGMDNIMTFGDSYNDIPMLEAAGWGVCMANGADEAKKASRIIAPSNDDEGVAYVIEKEILGI